MLLIKLSWMLFLVDAAVHTQQYRNVRLLNGSFAVATNKFAIHLAVSIIVFNLKHPFFEASKWIFQQHTGGEGCHI